MCTPSNVAKRFVAPPLLFKKIFNCPGTLFPLCTLFSHYCTLILYIIVPWYTKAVSFAVSDELIFGFIGSSVGIGLLTCKNSRVAPDTTRDFILECGNAFYMVFYKLTPSPPKNPLQQIFRHFRYVKRRHWSESGFTIERNCSEIAQTCWLWIKYSPT